MSFSDYIFQYLLIVPHALLVVVLVALLRRRLYREFPIFFAFIVSEIIQAVVLIPIIESPSITREQYAIAYSLSYAVNAAFRLGVVYEIFAYAFRNYLELGRFGRPLFRWVTVGLIFLAFGLAALTRVDVSRLMLVQQLLHRATSMVLCGLLLTLFVLSSQLRLSWRGHIFGITLGMGIAASAELAVSAIRSEIGLTHQMALNYFVMAAYHFCVLIWIFYLVAPERSYAPKALPQHDLDSWNVELERLLK